MKSILKYILPVLFLSCSLTSQEKNNYQRNFPEPKFDYITMEDGLPENAPRSIIQDHFGYLWIATKNGLARFDGYDVIVYSRDINNPQSISHRSIKIIYKDRKGTLWAGTEGNIIYVFEDNKNNSWVGTYYSGIHLFDKERGNSIKNFSEQF